MAVKRKGRTNYTQKTLGYLRELGWSVDIVEKWNAYAGPFGQREDAFGFIDILALDPVARCIVAVQSTGPSGHSEHRRSMIKNPFAKEWLECRGSIQLISWRKLLVKRGGKAKQWRIRVEIITLDDMRVEEIQI